MSQYSPMGSSVSVPNQDFSRWPPQIRGTARGVNLTGSKLFMGIPFQRPAQGPVFLMLRCGAGSAAGEKDAASAGSTAAMRSTLPLYRFLSAGSYRIVAPHWTDCDNPRSEEHTSELQSRENLVCRLL